MPYHRTGGSRRKANAKGGRPSGSKPYSKAFATKIGATVLVRFRKTRATTEEVQTALRQALSSLS